MKPESVTCCVCGFRADSPPITWMREMDARLGEVWVCDICSRKNLRSIEAKLDRHHW